MARAWQRWLSPRPLVRTNTSTQNTFYSAGGMARFDIIPEKDNSWSLRETHYIEHPRVKAGLSGPPLHVHFRQDEHFKVEQGVLAAIVDGKEYALTKADGVLSIRAGSRHRFWSPPSSTESLVFHGWADPCKDEDHILDINFLRNIVGYVADCEKAGISLSIFQIILFYQDASSLWTPSALNWMPLWIISMIHYVAAYGIAMTLLGYVTALITLILSSGLCYGTVFGDIEFLNEPLLLDFRLLSAHPPPVGPQAGYKTSYPEYTGQQKRE